jgi:capsular exopolysaccharide synthesis family protein
MSEISPFFIRRENPLQGENKVSFGSPVVEESPGLRDYWRVVKKRRSIIAIFFFGVVMSTAVALFVMTPIYTAGTTLLIEPKNPDVVNIKQVLSEPLGQHDYDYYKTQYQILKSRSLAAEVIQEQGLDQNALFTGDRTAGGTTELWADATAWLKGQVWASWIFDPIAELWTNATAWLNEQKALFRQASQTPKSDGEDSLGINPSLIDTYQGKLKIEPAKGTQLVKIEFSSPDPEFSAKISNAHADAYIRQGVNLRTQANQEAQRFLETKLAELKERVEKSEAALNSFRREKGILSLSDKENIVVERLADLNRRLTDAEAERIGLEAQARLISKRAYDSLPAVINNGLIGSLKAQLVRFEGEYAHLASQFKPGYPRLAQLKAQMEETRQRLGEEIRSVVGGINSAYAAAAGKEKELRTQMDKQKAETLAQKDAAVEYAILAREVDTNSQLYNSVLGRMKETGVAAEIRTSNVSIIDQAEPPLEPSKPKKKFTLLLAAIVGLVGGLGLAFFSEYLDNTLKTPEDVERYLRLPNLAIVPDFLHLPKAPRNGKLRISRQESTLNSKLCVPTKKVALSGLPLSGITEAYRKLRTSIFLSRPGEPPQTILFTSGTNAEGKTVTVANTAIMFAQTGLRVLVIDADLRRPSCHKALKVRNGPGLTDFLTGQVELEKMIKPTSIANLFVLNCGSTPPNPTELVGSKKMHDTLADLKNRYDFILIDSPPVMPVSDAVVLSTMVEGVVLVVRAQETRKDLVKAAVSQLGNGQGKILGVVLNRVDIRSADYTGYQYYYPHFYTRETEA